MEDQLSLVLMGRRVQILISVRVTYATVVLL